MLEYIFTALIIGVALVLAGRSLYRTVKGDKPGCACDVNGGCGVHNHCQIGRKASHK